MVIQRTATVFGGSGFLGTHVVRKLAEDGYLVRVACRRTDLANSLRQLGDVGQVTPFHAPVGQEDDVRTAIAGADVVINLAGILGGPSLAKLHAVNVEGASRVARIAASLGVRTYVHMSAIGASATAPSAYGRSRAAGEAEVLAHFPTVTIVRASVLFGPEDHFFNLMATLARYIPCVMPVYGARTKVQPVYVGDVAEAIRRIVNASEALNPVSFRLCELAGPEVLTMEEIARRTLAMTHRHKIVLAIPDALANLQAAVLERLPGQMLTRDQLKMLHADNVPSGEYPGFPALDMSPTPIDLVVPAYLARYAMRTSL